MGRIEDLGGFIVYNCVLVAGCLGCDAVVKTVCDLHLGFSVSVAGCLDFDALKSSKINFDSVSTLRIPSFLKIKINS